MTIDDAKLIIAHDSGVKLTDYLASDDLNRIRQIRTQISSSPLPKEQRTSEKGRRVREAPGSQESLSALFDARLFHSEVVKSARKRFTGSHFNDAVRASAQRVHNRAKSLAGVQAEDGQAAMGMIFQEKAALLQASPLSKKSDIDEHTGFRFLFMGVVAALRNPISHEDDWYWSRDKTAALEALSLISLLHRFLDRCETLRTHPKP